MLWAVLARLWAFVSLAHLPVGDPAAYAVLSHSIASGQGLVFNDYLYGSGLRAFYPPTYPMLLASFVSVGFGNASALTLNTLCDVGAALTMRRLGIETKQPFANVAALAYLSWPTIVLGSPLPQKESLVAFLGVQLCLLFYRLWRDQGASLKWAAHAGVVSGLLALAQPGLALLPVGLGFVVLPKTGLTQLAKVAALTFPFVLFPMVPWWYRNWELFGQFVPLTTSSGLSLRYVILGNHYAIGGLAALPEPTRSTAAMQWGGQWIRAHPAQYFSRVLIRTVGAFALDDFSWRRFHDYTPRWHFARVGVDGLWVVLLALVATSVKRPNRALLVLLLGSALALSTSIWFEFSQRHRYFLFPLLFLLAGGGVAALIDLRRARKTGLPPSAQKALCSSRSPS